MAAQKAVPAVLGTVEAQLGIGAPLAAAALAQLRSKSSSAAAPSAPPPAAAAAAAAADASVPLRRPHVTDTSSHVLLFYSHTRPMGEDEPRWAERRAACAALKSTIFSNLFPCTIRLVPSEGVFRGGADGGEAGVSSSAGAAAGGAAADGAGETKEEEFASTEHYFQMAKYGPSDRAFMKLLNSNDVAAYGQRRLKMTKKHLARFDQLPEGVAAPARPRGEAYKVGDRVEPVLATDVWHSPAPGDRVKAMLRALRAKFSKEQHPELLEQLLATDGCWLVEHTRNDSQWADGATGVGMNFLGKLLCILRAERLERIDTATADALAADEDFMCAPQNTWVEYD